MTLAAIILLIAAQGTWAQYGINGQYGKPYGARLPMMIGLLSRGCPCSMQVLPPCLPCQQVPPSAPDGNLDVNEMDQDPQPTLPPPPPPYQPADPPQQAPCIVPQSCICVPGLLSLGCLHTCFPVPVLGNPSPIQQYPGSMNQQIGQNYYPTQQLYPGQGVNQLYPTGSMYPGSRTQQVYGQSLTQSAYPGQSLDPGQILTNSLNPGQSLTQSLYPGQSPTQSQYAGQYPAQSLYPGQSPPQSLYPGQSLTQSMYPQNQPLQPQNYPGASRNTYRKQKSSQSPRELLKKDHKKNDE